MYNIAIVGPSGLVGSSIISLLNKQNLSAHYYLFGKHSIGNTITISHKQYKVLDIDDITSYQIDYALFATTASIASHYIPQLVSLGCICIDNSSYYRMNDAVPLIAPHVNAKHIHAHRGIISNPNCTTIQLATVLHALKPLGLRRVVCSTYQAVSGAGREALDDLHNCAQYGSLRNMLHPIADNIIPQIDDFANDGKTLEEHKVINESRKILGMPELAISCMAVRVPISCGHSISANIHTDTNFTIEDIHCLLNNTSNIVLYDNPAKGIYPMPIIARNTHAVYVGRIHIDSSQANTFNCFIVADNILRGASYNALEILLALLEHEDEI